MKTTLVAGDVEHPDQLPLMIRNRRRRTGQKVIRRQKVLIRVHQRWRAFSDGRTDGVGALALFRPGDAGLQGNTVCFFQKIIVAHGVQNHTLCIGENHHIVGVNDLLVECLHHRHSMGMQATVLVNLVGQVGFLQRRVVRLGILRQPKRRRAFVGFFDHMTLIGRMNYANRRELLFRQCQAPGIHRSSSIPVRLRGCHTRHVLSP